MTESDEMRDHFWWRPGWEPGRAYLTWHFLPDPGVLPYIRALQRRLRGVSGLVEVASPRLHVTGPGVGFADELDPKQVGAMVQAAAAAVATIPVFAAPLGGPEVGPSGVHLPLGGAGLARVRLALREAARGVGIDVPGDDGEPYRPHLSIAYATGPGSRSATAALLADVEPPKGLPPMVRVDGATLLALQMVPPRYDWVALARVPLAE